MGFREKKPGLLTRAAQAGLAVGGVYLGNTIGGGNWDPATAQGGAAWLTAFGFSAGAVIFPDMVTYAKGRVQRD